MLLCSTALASTSVLFMSAGVGQGSGEEQQGQLEAPRGGAVVGIAITPELLARGRRVYERSCGSCHGASGEGNPPSGGFPAVTPADLRKAPLMSGRTDSDIARIVRYGAFQMPPSPGIGGDDLLGLVAFVRRFSDPEVETVDPEAAAQDRVEDYQPVTGGMLEEPPDSDWLMFRGNYRGWGYSPLRQITTRNVDNLQLAWSRAMESGGQYTTPLVHDGVMYLAHPGDVIQALNGRSGDLIWEYRRGGQERRRVRNLRNLAIFEDKIYTFTSDGFLLALSAVDGSIVWQTKEAEPGSGIGHMGGPFIVDEKVVSGRSCSAVGGPGICYIAAHDARTGQELWRTYTIPKPGEPGDETWGDVPWEERLHINTWGNVPSYDPDLNLIYWGTSVPAPSLEVLRGTAGLDVLYSNSTIATDADTGEIVWYYQHLPRDNWDLDHVFERFLVDVEVAPDPSEVEWISPNVTLGERRRVITGMPGKTGIVYTLDRETGEFLWARQTLHQNVITDIDPATGKVSVNEDVIVGPFEKILVCPSSGGGKNWPAGAYSPRTGLMYQPLQNMCMYMTGITDKPTPAEGYATSRIFLKDPTLPEPYKVGQVVAVDLTDGRTEWLHQQRAGMIGTLLSTGGGLVFGGDVNRRFKALDASTGEVLWETIVSGPVSGSAISYAIDQRQYVAIPVGGDTASPEKRVLYLHHEIRPPQGLNAIFVFMLPERVLERENNASRTLTSWLLLPLGIMLLLTAWWFLRRLIAARSQAP